MKEMDYVIMRGGGHWTITPRSARGKARTNQAREFPDAASALEFVRAGVAEGYRFSGRELVDREYRLVRYGYFVARDGGQLIASPNQDWGPPDPVFEPGDRYPGGPHNGMHAIVRQVVTGQFARLAGVDVMIVLEEVRVDPAAN